MFAPRVGTSEQPDYMSAGSFVKLKIFRERLCVSEVMPWGRVLFTEVLEDSMELKNCKTITRRVAELQAQGRTALCLNNLGNVLPRDRVFRP